MKTLLRAALAALLLSAVPGWANTWLVADNSQCTGFGAATGIGAGRFDCCRGTAAAGSSTCDTKFSIGPWWMRSVSLGTDGTTEVYTTGGDALNAAALAKIGLSTIIAGDCGIVNAPSNAAFLAELVPTATGAKIMVYEMGAAVDTTAANGAFKEASPSQVMINTAVSCRIFGL